MNLDELRRRLAIASIATTALTTVVEAGKYVYVNGSRAEALNLVVTALRMPIPPPTDVAIKDPSWDPEPSVVEAVAEEGEEEEEDYFDSLIDEAPQCRALLLEIVRRAANDWVLYRMSSNLHNRKLAEDAYTWLFEEDEDHKNWREREAAGKQLTSFLSICNMVDIDPEIIRTRVRQMTIKDIMSVGRPAENRRREDVSLSEHAISSDEGSVGEALTGIERSLAEEGPWAVSGFSFR